LILIKVNVFSKAPRSPCKPLGEPGKTFFGPKLREEKRRGR
jgi:hypothetical protein